MAQVETKYGSYNTTLKNEVVRDVNNQWDQDMFLKVLVAQMTHQDPMQPTSDTEFIGQMAQFSTLEQITKLNSSITNMQGYNLVGKHIYAEYLPSGSSNYLAVLGKVDSVVQLNGITYAIINQPRTDADGNYVRDEDGKIKIDTYSVPMADVIEVIDSSVFESASTDAQKQELIDRLKALYGLSGSTTVEKVGGDEETGETGKTGETGGTGEAGGTGETGETNTDG